VIIQFCIGTRQGSGEGERENVCKEFPLWLQVGAILVEKNNFNVKTTDEEEEEEEEEKDESILLLSDAVWDVSGIAKVGGIQEQQLSTVSSAGESGRAWR